MGQSLPVVLVEREVVARRSGLAAALSHAHGRSGSRPFVKKKHATCDRTRPGEDWTIKNQGIPLMITILFAITALFHVVIPVGTAAILA